MDTIAVDIGNSRIKAGLFSGKRLKKVLCLPACDVNNFCFPASWKSANPGYAAIASVVPHAVRAVRKGIKENFKGAKVVVLEPEDCGIPLRIKNPASVGIDRVLNCLAVLKLFGPGAVVVDIGTAVTVDILSEKGEFAGGFIIPGQKLWLESLSRAAMIKSIKKASPGIPGKDTDEAIHAGFEYGLPGAINAILEKVFKKYPSAKLYITGGGSRQVSKHIGFRKCLREHLALEGINYVISKRTGGDDAPVQRI
jgi:type III pantothenate kinase